MHARVQGRGPWRDNFWTPSLSHRIDLYGRVGGVIFVESGEDHNPAVAQRGSSGIPAAMHHGLLIREYVRQRVEYRRFYVAKKRIILDRAPQHKRSSIEESHHAVTEHVKVHGLLGDGSRLRIPNGGLKVFIFRNIA